MNTLTKNIFQYLLSTDGVNQYKRSPSALDPSSVKLDGRTMSELVQFIYELSTEVRYYDKNKLPQGDWQPFFEQLISGGEVLNDDGLNLLISQRSNLSPHIALLLAYLKIYSIAKEDMNIITKKRLDYYYEEVLQLKRKSASPDHVHLLFELSKNAKPVLIPAGALVDGGKTNTGLPLHYALESELLVSHAIVGSIKSSYTDFNIAGKSIIFKSNDATKVLNETATAWRPFGSSQLSLSPESRTMEPVAFGWSVASPNLLLAEGNRTVKLKINLRSIPGTAFPKLILSPMLNASMTGEKGWVSEGLVLKAELIPEIPIEFQNILLENPFVLEVTVTLSAAIEAITAYNEAVHKESFSTRWPVLRMLLRPESFIMDTLSRFRVENINIEVEARDVKNLILQNDQSLQPSDKPILPFGSTPLIQSNFYIGSKEIFSKSLTSLNVKLEWQDAPENFTQHYAAYGNNQIINSVFATAVDLLSNKNWNVRLVNSATLFNSSNPTLVQNITVNKSSFAFQTANAPFKRNPDLELPDGFTNFSNQGFIKLVLISPIKSTVGNQPADAPFEAFGHKTFSTAYTQQVILLSKWDGVTPPTAPELPKPPYTPTLKSVSVDYTASDSFRPDQPNHIEQYFVQDVFGPAETEKNDSVSLIASQPGTGSLYIGLQNATAPQLISFLFQIEEGSVEGAKLLESTDLQWSYLSGNHWRDIASSDIIEDTTSGFQKPGLVKLNIGHDATDEHNLMPDAMRWLRVSVKDNPEGAAAIEKINTQAGRAVLVLPSGNVKGYEDHLSGPLKAGTISKLVIKPAGLKKVTQPFASFGGQNSETDYAFYRRVSERLRHKNRAVSGWDYERVLLENFPEIFKIKSLPHSAKEDFFQPGNVRLVVVPDWRKRPTGNPLQPKVNQNRLLEIEQFFANTYTSPFIKIHVTNPTYETLLFDCKVSFHPGFDAGYYSDVLNEDIKKFLSPWAYVEGQDIVFGGKVHASEILAFIEGRVYVDFVVDFELYHRYTGTPGGGISEMEINFDFIVGSSPEPSIGNTIGDNGGKTISIDFVVGVPVEVAAATRPDSILVSNNDHRVQALQAGGSNCQGIQQIGIGQMIIGLDFVPIS